MDMLSLFPQILFLSPLSATLLRITVAAAFFIAAYLQWQRRRHLSQGLLWGSLLFHVALGSMLFVGFYTQLAALLGGIGSLSGLFKNRSTEAFVVFSRGSLLLIIVMCLSLLMTGAGAFALDLPL